MSAVAGFVVAFRMNDFDIKFKALGWAYPIAKASAGAIQVTYIMMHSMQSIQRLCIPIYACSGAMHESID